jgi:hypothetical protein
VKKIGRIKGEKQLLSKHVQRERERERVREGVWEGERGWCKKLTEPSCLTSQKMISASFPL